MTKHFSELSDAARSAIIDAVLDIDVPNLPDDVRQEIREWATPCRSIYVVVKSDSWGSSCDISEHDTKEAAEAAAAEIFGAVHVEEREISF